MNAIDIFAGAGGMSWGAQAAGIKVVAAVEADPNAALTYQRNHQHATVMQQDIRRIKAKHLGKLARPSVLFGGPPCQGFSYSNLRTRGLTNPDNWLFREFLRIARILEPDWIVIENVQGLRNTADGRFMKEICDRMCDMGYSVACWLLNAMHYGVPQDRTRLFIIGSRFSMPPAPPSPTASRANVRQAIGDLPSLLNGADVDCLPYRARSPSRYALTMRGRRRTCSGNLVSRNSPLVIKRYQHIPPGGNWRHIPSRLMGNYSDRTRCHTGIYRRLEWDRPSVVIGNYRKNMLIHPEEDRGLSVREAARLQSFPDSYVFTGSIGFKQQLVGNAVPPLLAKSVFQTLVAFS